ncbi:molecular chaperone [Sphingopyxis sp. CCNWLW253]|uniref:fimbrial biogenesis chaperone n=1 Tax=unclassified Sphingopyxis TaxID=2614943 RepID=UPI003012D205
MNQGLLFMVAPALLAAAASAGAQQPGSLLIWPVNPVIEGDARAAALWLENPGKAPITLQVRVYAWDQQDGRNLYAEQSDVIGTPPIVSIEPGQRQLIRLTRTASPAAVAEKPYRVVVDEIPVARESAAPGASVSFRMRYSLPLFSYPPRGDGKVKPPAPAPQISWRAGADAGGRFLEIQNGGTGHAQLTDVGFVTGPQKSPVAGGLLGYVLPGASMRWPLPGNVGGTGDLVATVNGKAGVRIERRHE